jgi:hypothetical protein
VRVRLSIRLKVFAALVAGLVGVAGATALLMRFVHGRAIELATAQELEGASRALAHEEEQELERLSSVVDVILADERLGRLLEARDRGGLLAAATPVFEALRARHGITHWYFHDADPARGVLLRVHQPDVRSAAGDGTPRRLLALASATQMEARGRELNATGWALRVVRPWMHQGRLAGYVELGEDVRAFLGRLKATTGDDYGLLLDRRRLDPAAWAWTLGAKAGWDARPELVAIETTTGTDEMLHGIGRVGEIPDVATVLDSRNPGGRAVVRGVFPIRSDEGEGKVGAVVVLHDVSALRAGADEVKGRVLLVVVLLAAGLAALVVFLLEALVFDRLAHLERVLEALPERLARGDDPAGDLESSGDDEIGRFEAFFRRGIEAVGSFVSDVRRERAASRREEGDRRRR